MSDELAFPYLRGRIVMEHPGTGHIQGKIDYAAILQYSNDVNKPEMDAQGHVIKLVLIIFRACTQLSSSFLGPRSHGIGVAPKRPPATFCDTLTSLGRSKLMDFPSKAQLTELELSLWLALLITSCRCHRHQSRNCRLQFLTSSSSSYRCANRFSSKGLVLCLLNVSDACLHQGLLEQIAFLPTPPLEVSLPQHDIVRDAW